MSIGPVAGSSIGGQPSPYDLAQAAAARLATGPGAIRPSMPPNAGAGERMGIAPNPLAHYGVHNAPEPLHGANPASFGGGEGQVTPPTPPLPPGLGGNLPPGFGGPIPNPNPGEVAYPGGSPGGIPIAPVGQPQMPDRLREMLQQAALRRLGAPNG